ncbi:glycosyltransferase [Klebsiella pneumoniae]|nr:glycosyltransferase [Klebsiella pneumoniae]
MKLRKFPMREYESSNEYWISILGKQPIFIFPVRMIGGHELMALEILKACISEGVNVRVFIEPTNNALEKKLIQECGVIPDNLVKLPVKQQRFEIIQSALNIKIKKKIWLFLKQQLNIPYSSLFLVQGDIEIGSLITETLNKNRIDYISYLPYLHSAKIMDKKLWFIRDILANRILLKTKHIVTISEVFKAQILKRNENCVVEVFRNRVRNLEEFRSKRASTIDSNKKAKLNITIIGRVSFKQKGHDRLLSALSRLNSKQLGTLELHVIGDGEDMEYFSDQCKKKLPTLEVYMHGWSQEPWDIAYNTDLLLIPSRFEGVPLVMLEALSLGIPILASNRDGMQEYLTAESLFDNEAELAILLIDYLNSKK